MKPSLGRVIDVLYVHRHPPPPYVHGRPVTMHAGDLFVILDEEDGDLYSRETWLKILSPRLGIVWLSSTYSLNWKLL